MPTLPARRHFGARKRPCKPLSQACVLCIVKSLRILAEAPPRPTRYSPLDTGHTEVVDADLSGYFDSIPHAELMKSVARRVSDGAMLHLIKMWLEAPVEEIDERGRHH